MTDSSPSGPPEPQPREPWPPRQPQSGSPLSRTPLSDDAIRQQVGHWIQGVVVGLNLCPFAGSVWREGRIRLTVSRSTTIEDLLFEIAEEVARLDRSPPEQLETTLVIIPEQLHEFEEYNDFLDDVDALLRELDREGVYQAASFHPGYLFAEAEPDDQANATNRSPWPIIHLLREESITKVVGPDYDMDAIPGANIARLRGLNPEEFAKLFPWLTSGPET